MTSTPLKFRIPFIAVFCAAFVLAACGGGGSSSPAPAPDIPIQATATVLVGGAKGDRDGSAAVAQFNGLTSIAAANGSLYVADAGNVKVKKISLDGTATTLLTYRSDSIAGSISPVSVAVNSSGTVYFRTNPTNISTTAIFQVVANGAAEAVRFPPDGSSRSLLGVDGGGVLYYDTNSQITALDVSGTTRLIGAPKPLSSFSVDASGTVYYSTLPNISAGITDDTVGTIDRAGKDTVRKRLPQIKFFLYTTNDDRGNLYFGSGSLISKVTEDGTMTTVIDLGKALSDVNPDSAVVRGMVWYAGALYVASEDRILKVAPVN